MYFLESPEKRWRFSSPRCKCYREGRALYPFRLELVGIHVADLGLGIVDRIVRDKTAKFLPVFEAEGENGQAEDGLGWSLRKYSRACFIENKGRN